MGQRVREAGRLPGLAAADPRDHRVRAALEGRDGGGDRGLLLQLAVRWRTRDGAGVGDDADRAVRLMAVRGCAGYRLRCHRPLVV